MSDGGGAEWGEGGTREGKGDCRREREEANAEARNGNEAAYVPECSDKGKQ